MTAQTIAEALHEQVGSPLRGAGPCLGFVMRLDDLLARWVREVQKVQRAGQLLDLPPEVVARRLMVEVLKPGATRDHDCPEVW